VASPVLVPLNCTKCGASLPAEEGQRVLTCPYCGQKHAFVPPTDTVPTMPTRPVAPAQTSSPALKIALAAFAVMIVASVVFTALLSGRRGTGASTPAATPAAALPAATTAGPGDPHTVYTKGQNVDIFWGSSWWPGAVVNVDGARYLAHYDGYTAVWDEWVTAERLRPRDAAAHP